MNYDRNAPYLQAPEAWPLNLTFLLVPGKSLNIWIPAMPQSQMVYFWLAFSHKIQDKSSAHT